MDLNEYLKRLKERPPLEYDNSEHAFWERYNGYGETVDEFCYRVGFIEIT